MRPGYDYVLIGRRAALDLPFERLIEDFGRALGRVHAAGRSRPPPHMRAQGRTPDMTDQKNTILAIVLSALVLIAWQYFVGLPQMEKQKQEAQLKAQQQQQQVQTPVRRPAAAGQPAAGAPRAACSRNCPARRGRRLAGQQLSREAVLAASPRITIETPRLRGSIALKGAQIDDLALTQYHETVDQNSPPIVLLSPSGSPHPFYAEFGWVGGAGAHGQGCPTPTRSGRQQGSGALGVGKPVTLTYDNGEGLAVPPHHLGRRQVPVHGRGPGRQQERRAGRALSVRIDPRHGTPRDARATTSCTKA